MREYKGCILARREESLAKGRRDPGRTFPEVSTTEPQFDDPTGNISNFNNWLWVKPENERPWTEQ